jgi:cytidine deaminase
VCAERTANFAAVSAGERRIQGLALVTQADEPGWPCGACLQVIQEFTAEAAMPIVVANTSGRRLDLTLADLFPHPFRLP